MALVGGCSHTEMGCLAIVPNSIEELGKLYSCIGLVPVRDWLQGTQYVYAQAVLSCSQTISMRNQLDLIYGSEARAFLDGLLYGIVVV